MTHNKNAEEIRKKAERELKQEVGNRFKQLRGHYTLKQAEELTGVSEAYIVRIEKGRINPSVTIMQKLARGYGSNLGDVFRPWLERTDKPEHHLLHEKLRELLQSDYEEAIRVNVEAVYLLYMTSKRAKR